MPDIWFRSRAGSGYGPASGKGWAILVTCALGVTLVGIGLPMLAGGAIWSWLIAPLLVMAATIWLFRIVRSHSNKQE